MNSLLGAISGGRLIRGKKGRIPPNCGRSLQSTAMTALAPMPTFTVAGSNVEGAKGRGSLCEG